MQDRIAIRRFTLIEMLAVVTIASIMIAVFVPSFNRMMFGSKVDQAASNFKLGLEVAQSHAVSSRKYVAMVIPVKYGDVTATALKPYCDGGYRLAFVKKSGSNWHFSDWLPESSWRNPRDGAALTALGTLKQLTLASGASVASGDDWESLGSADNRKAVVFSPYGGTADQNDVSFTFTEARFTGNTDSGDKAVYDIPNGDNRLTLQVKGITGRVSYQ